MADLVRPIQRLVWQGAWAAGSTLNIDLPRDQLVQRYIVFIYSTVAGSTPVAVGMIRAIASATLFDADGNPIKSGHAFMHNMYNGLWVGRGVRPIGERNVGATSPSPQYGMFMFEFELFPGDTRFLFPAFAMHSLTLQIVCSAMAVMAGSTFAATIQVFEEGYLKSSLPKAFLTRETWHTIINRQRVWEIPSIGVDQRQPLWRGTHMRRMILIHDDEANLCFDYATSCDLTNIDRIRTYRNGTLITDNIFRVCYLRDVLDYGKALPAEATEAGLIIATTVIDDHCECVIEYEMSVGEQKSLLNLVGADSFEIGLDTTVVDVNCLLYSEELV